jgi:DNA primase
LSRRQAEIIHRVRPPRITCMFDKDAAGVRNVFSTAERVPQCPIFVCLYPGHRKDPAELTKKEVERAIEKAIPLVKFKRRVEERRLKRPPETRKKEALYG